MNNLKNIIESIVFASGEAVPVRFIAEKLGCSVKEINDAVKELREQYSGDCGIELLVFNGKIQMASNPKYKDDVAAVLVPIKEKELTKTILECVALIAYKQPITRSELEDLRQVSCDYAIKTLLELNMIEICGRKDTIGKPILYCTTDTFLKRFKLESINDLPDYNELMAQIAQLNNTALTDANYLYARDEYVESSDEVAPTESQTANETTVNDEASDLPQENSADNSPDGQDSDIPDFLSGEDIIIKIK